MAAKQKWWQVYQNADEQSFFTGKDGLSGLARHPKWSWRSLKSVADEAGLTEERTEQIMDKYVRAGIVVRNDGGDKFAYWERANQTDPSDVVKDDQKARMKKAAT